MGRYSDILFVSDFDRTLTGTELGLVPPENIEAIERFEAEGGAFTVATGRTREFFAQHGSALPLNAPCVIANGAELYDYRTAERLALFPLGEEGEALFTQLSRRYPTLAGEVQSLDGRYYFNYSEEFARRMRSIKQDVKEAPLERVPRPWLQLGFSGRSIGTFDYCKPEDAAAVADVVRYVNEELSDALFAVRSMPAKAEITAAGVNKGRTARELARRLGRSVLVAAGDSPNDLSMLLEADRAFVPADCNEALRQYGFETVAAADLGAVADAIGRL